MRKILTALIAAASVGAAAIASPSPAKAWWGWGPAVAGGVVAGASLAVHSHRDRTIRLPITTGRTLITDPLRQSLERLRVGACVLIFHDGIRKSRNLTQRELLTHVIHMESKKIVGIMVDGFRSEGN